MDIKYVKLVNFLSHKSTEFKFDKPLVLLCGRGGVGKSAILTSITVALFKEARGVGPRATNIDGLIRNGSDTMGIEVCFDLSGTDVKVRYFKRVGETPHHKVYINGNLDSTMTSNATKRIEELLGVNGSVFCCSVFLRQDESDTFLSKGTKGRREVLKSVLQLDLFDKWVEIAKEGRKQVRRLYDNHTSQIGLVQQMISQTKTELDTPPTLQTLRGTITGLEQRHTQYTKELSEQEQNRVQWELYTDLRSQHKGVENRLTTLKEQVVVGDEQGLKLRQKELDEQHGGLLGQKMQLELNIRTEEINTQKIRTEVSHFRSLGELCPTCKQSVTQEWKNDYCNKLDEKIRTQETLIHQMRTSYESVRTAYELTTSEMDTIKQQLERFEDGRGSQVEFNLLQQQIMDLDIRIKQYSMITYNPIACNTIRRQIADIDSELKRIQYEIGRKVKSQEQYGVLVTQLTTLQYQCSELEPKLKAYEALVKIYSELPAIIVNNTLPQLEHYTNNVLTRLTEGEMSITFNTSEEQLNVMISSGGEERLYEFCSSSERFKVDFSVRIALSLLLAHRAGTKLETVFIDEGMGCLDAESRSAFVEMVQRLSNEKLFKKVIVITHLEDIKEYFPDRIELAKDPILGTLQTS